MAKNNYITAELDWAEAQLNTWREYIDANPIHELADRMAYKQTARGQISVVAATIEAQVKAIRDTMKEYLSLLEVVDRLREKEEKKKVSVRGDVELGSMAADYLNKRK